MKLVKSLFKKLKYLWKTKRWWLIGGLIVLLVIGRGFYKRAQSQKTLTFVSPTRENLVKTLDVSGVVDAKEKASMHFLAGGKIVYLGAHEGDAVKKWQTIATIDRASLSKTQEKDLNLYSKERLDWDQQLADINNRTIDQTELRTVQKNQLDLNNSVIDVQLAAIAVSNTVMSSPVKGILVSSPTNVPGVMLGPTDSFLIVNPDTLIFRALVDESDIASVQKNQTATIQLDAYPNETIDSAVDYIAYQSSLGTSGTVFAVQFPISAVTDLEKYRLGMNGDVHIKLEEKDGILTIPLIATRERDGKTYVDVKTGPKTTAEREITIGLTTDEKVEVVSGLTESDQVVLPQ